MDPVRGGIRFAMALAIGGSALSVLSLALVAFTLHALLTTPHTWPWALMTGLLASTVGAFLLRQVAFRHSHYAAFRLEAILRTRLADHIAHLPLGRVQTLGAGQIAKVIHDDVKALHVFVADSTPMVARAYASPLLATLVLLWLDWPLALAALAVPVTGFAILGVIVRNSRETSERYNNAREQVAAAVVEFVQAMPVVRTFDTGSTSFGRYQRALLDYLKVLKDWYASVRFSSRFSLAILSTLPTLTVLLWVGGWRFAHGTQDFSTWIAALLIGAGLAEAILPMMSLHHLVQKTRISIERIQQILAEPPLPEVPAPGRQPADASVVFEHVSFSYEKADIPALQDVSFTAAPGTITALVGPSGAGKSTVARLIPRFWDVDTGRVRVGGTDVRDMTADTLMQQVAFVFQDTFLFATSIADNIRLGCPDASMDDVIAAARAAQAHDFISALPKGYETRAGERGTFLSGGQRQRITIARAILQNRPILVLDEATAFADPENEAALVRALSALMHGKTVLMVAHRLATIQNADQILVFDQGRLAERGQHDDLLQRHGVYARLWQSGQDAGQWTLPATAGHATIPSHTSA
jgi:permease and ATP-binding protein of yersiniabactin-iron ABC transporter